MSIKRKQNKKSVTLVQAEVKGWRQFPLNLFQFLNSDKKEEKFLYFKQKFDLYTPTVSAALRKSI